MTDMQEEQRRKQILKNMKRMAQQSQQVCNDTKVQLFKQSQQLTTIQQSMQKLDKQTDKTKKLSRQISSFWYYLKDKFKGKKADTTENVQYEQKEQVQRRENKEIYGEGRVDRKGEGNGDGEEDQDDVIESLYEKMKGVKKGQQEIGDILDSDNRRVDKLIAKNDKINQKIVESHKLIAKKL